MQTLTQIKGSVEKFASGKTTSDDMAQQIDPTNEELPILWEAAMNKAKAKALQQQAEAEVEAKDFKGAIDTFNEALDIDPE